jgi:hypothetical protein
MISALEIHGVPLECINQAAITYHVPATFDETGEHCKSNASRRAHDRRALTGEAGNASRRKVIVEATARSLEWASAWRTQDESGPTFSRVIRTNFGDRMAKIFRENSDSLVTMALCKLIQFGYRKLDCMVIRNSSCNMILVLM